MLLGKLDIRPVAWYYFGMRETADIETASEDYARRFAGRTGAWMLDVQGDIVRAMVGPPTGRRRLLDVGGGHGQVAGIFQAMGWNVTVHGSDAVCADRLPESLRLGFVAADTLNLPFADRSFEQVVCLRLLTHCRSWERLVAELGRVALDAVTVDFPVAGGLNRWAPALFDWKKKLEGNTRHWRQFARNEVEPVFAAQGFSLRQQQAQFFWPMVLHRRLKLPAVSRTLENMARGLGLTERFGSPVIVKMVRDES